jgi:hypothetical protein
MNSQKAVTPVKTGVQFIQEPLDPGFRRGDDSGDSLRDHETLSGEENFLNLSRPFSLLIVSTVCCRKDPSV